MLPSSVVRAAAVGHWDEILCQVGGLDESETKPGSRGMPCPHCGGHDRYEFKSRDNGHYLCRGCGAGDGWSLVMKMLHCDFSDAVQRVAEYLRLEPDRDHCRPVRQPPQPQPSQHDVIANKALFLWQKSQPADKTHPYLVKKRLSACYFRQYRDSLVLPVYSPEHVLVNLQFIRPDGGKTFLKGGRTRGCYMWWGQTSWTVYVCEGVADALSLHLTYHRLAIAAYSAGNISLVGSHLREVLPGHRLILVPDNDSPIATRKWRAGMAALYGHKSFDEVLILPEGKDPSDLWVASHGQR